MTHRRGPRSLMGVVLVAAVALGACGSDDADAPDGTTAATTVGPGTTGPDTTTIDDAVTSSVAGAASTTTSAAAGECPAGGDDTLDVATYVPTLGLDPLRVSGGAYGGLELAAIYDTLVAWNADAGEFVPWLAESLEADDTFTTWTLRLRPGVTFSDGTPLDADAVTAAIARHQDPANTSNLRNLVTPIVDMRVVGPEELVIQLDSPWPGFPFALANSPGMIANPAVATAMGADGKSPIDAALAAGAGAGPYVVTSYAPGEELVLEARDGYWGGEVCVPRLRFTSITGGTPTYEALQAGEIDVAVLRDPKATAAARADDAVRASWVMNLGEVLLINHGVKGTTPATTDVTVRQAIAAAIDPQRVDDVATGGTGLPGSGIFAAGGLLDPGVAGPAYDEAHAKELVEEAKAAGWDGQIDLSCDNAKTRQDMSIVIAAQLESAGIVVNLDNTRPINDHVGQVLQGNFELACWGINVNDVGAWAKLDKQLGGASTSNFAGFVDEQWDAALADLRIASTPDEQRAATARLQERADEVIPVIVLGASEEVIVTRDTVEGLTPSAESLVLFGNVQLGS